MTITFRQLEWLKDHLKGIEPTCNDVECDIPLFNDKGEEFVPETGVFIVPQKLRFRKEGNMWRIKDFELIIKWEDK